jgi:alginate O-acetyltransferase complex protein AlgI
VLFNSLPFLFGFLPPTYLVFWRLRTRRQRFAWLTLTGYVFYGFWDVRFCALMLFSTAVSYAAGRGLLAWADPRRRRACLVAPIVVDLLVLGFFKYVGFFLGSAAGLAAWLGVPLYPPALAVVLPVGISFYTFHTISYVVDAYRRAIVPTRDFFEFSCYVSLFSQLVAGPIVRFRQIEGDLAAIDRHRRTATVDLGWSFFALGMVEKVLLADRLAAVIDPALAAPAALSTAGAWLCLLGYAYQLYFDFDGYSNMAVGLGHLFGLRIPQNFDSPYQARNPADFWRRWHISLSTCLRDYLYIPLGGNRGPRALVYRNLLLTMLLGGLWHGASWTFVAWGAYHGLLLALYRATARWWDRLPAGLSRAATFGLVVVGWVFFRSLDFAMAATLLRTMFSWQPGPLPAATPGLLALLAVAALLAHRAPNAFQLSHRWRPAAALALTALFGLCLLAIYGGPASPFLYFQF